MARYIDADALIKVLDAKADMAMGTPKEVFLSVSKMVDYLPPADVTPRAEVEELIYKLECLLCHATGGKLSKHTYDLKTMETVVTDYINESYSEGVEDGYKDGAEEVAMEIFEEIETIKCVGLLPSSWVTQFAELKKKYTEAEAEPPKESKR